MLGDESGQKEDFFLEREHVIISMFSLGPVVLKSAYGPKFPKVLEN
jgi:hypothetical protein